ncbi:hypothetical protein [Lactobacillus melliventris]|uniref:Uncharacterized protein n=1 Tax=Lactobacillus melliventris TaxID=1218507 RepID=A0ABX5MZV2_9LACO|nr:hypothetical protein [Lactobacillus melliventris]MEB3363690.1 hypothetical protein [Lactobacillus sp. R2/2]NUE97214.1 hypothetical protein [Lactobacillus melliventris]PXY84383.1 hypothetical protein DK873_04310 [Lactobacillus melliventris]
MDPHKMTLQELGKYFYGRNVEFTLKNGQKKEIFVQDILNEDDDEPELTFLGGSVENEIKISDILSAREI